MNKEKTNITHEERIDEAFDKFKTIQNNSNGKGKFRSLSRFLLLQANQFSFEQNNTEKKKYRIYKRGQLVRVNFGLNFGSELSMIHYAIVLNKTDNKRNATLTVVPLSSKHKPHYLTLKHFISLDLTNRLLTKCKDLNFGERTEFAQAKAATTKRKINIVSATNDLVEKGENDKLIAEIKKE